MDFLEVIAKTGVFNEEWSDWKHVFEKRLKDNLWLFESSESLSMFQNDKKLNDGIPSNISESEKALFYKIIDTLFSNFSSHPPHTVQRLAELLLTPRQNYNSLPKYLRAIEKTIMVTSTVTDFDVLKTNIHNQIMDYNSSDIPNLTYIQWARNDQNESQNTHEEIV
ncbi:hypothetical protein PORY_000788 [Pneumocystis oryctolagi]|uniref:Uncharacterized protein n=1 Tax=Pneumocystis oryctolagi TaxID=42067 RepID=A0ACB7CE65_9ASCO|nr:hypothetical protein PORY_000788 [Pneumocystis oryctolagi]